MIRLLLGIAVCGFAAFRLTRIVTADSISTPLRAQVYNRAHDIGSPARAWRWAYGLISCPFCTGWWLSLGVWAVWRTWPDLRVVIAAVAVAGFQALLSHRAGD